MDTDATAQAPGLLQRLARQPARVAVLRASRLGDFLCAVPAFRALRMALPEAEITVITLPLLHDLAKRLPYFDRFAAFPGYPGLAEQLFDAPKALAFFARMQAQRFDLAVQLQGSGVNSNPFTLMLGAAASAGFVRPGDTAGRLSAALRLPEDGHEVDRVLALPRFLGAPERGRHTEFPLLIGDKVQARAVLAGLPAPWIGVHPGARDPARRWPLERFAASLRHVRRRWGGSIILLGGPEERRSAIALQQALGHACVNLAGRTGLALLAAVIARLDVLISSDSGPAHVGYALGTPTVTVFRRGGSQRYGPPARGPHRALEPEPLDLGGDELVHVSQVYAAADALLSPHPAPALQCLAPSGEVP